MKNLSIVLAVFVFAFASCSKSSDTTPTPTPAPTLTVEKANKGFFIEFSETWCGPCGTYGAPFFDACFDMEGTDLSLMKICTSSTFDPHQQGTSVLDVPAGSAIASDLWSQNQGVPTFFLNSSEMIAGGGTYTTVSANLSWVNSQLSTISSAPVVAGVALSKSISGKAMTVKTKVQFFAAQAAGKDFRLALYLVEDNVVADQNTSSGTIIKDAKHRNLLRMSASTNYKGFPLNSSAAITADQTFAKDDYTFVLNPAWKTADLKVVAVIYDATKTTGKPTVVNSNMAIK